MENQTHSIVVRLGHKFGASYAYYSFRYKGKKDSDYLERTVNNHSISQIIDDKQSTENIFDFPMVAFEYAFNFENACVKLSHRSQGSFMGTPLILFLKAITTGFIYLLLLI